MIRDMSFKRIFCLGLLLLGMCVTFQSCEKEPEPTTPKNLLLGTWELDHTEFKTAGGESISKKWDYKMTVTFKETSATAVFDLGFGTSTVPFGYYYENSVLHYNANAELSFDGESAKVLNLDQTEMRLLYRSDSAGWEEEISSGNTVQVISQIDIYLRK